MGKSVRIGVQFDGVDQAIQQAQRLNEIIGGLNAGGSPAGGISTPSIAPGNAPRLSPQQFGPTPTQAGVGPAPGTGYAYGQMVAGVLGGPANVGGGVVHPSPMGQIAYAQAHGGQGGNTQGQAAGSNSGPISVRIVDSVALTILGGVQGGGGSSGGSGGGFGTGFGGAGGPAPGWGQGGINGGGMQNPFPAGATAFNPTGKQGLGGLAQHILDGSGAANSVRSVLPASMAESVLGAATKFAGPLALAAAAADTIDMGFDIWGQGMLPSYGLQTQVMAAREQGQWIDPLSLRAQRQVAQDQGGINGWEAFRGSFMGKTLRNIGLGVPDLIWDYGMKPAFDRKLALDQAQGPADINDRTWQRMMGVSDAGDPYLVPRTQLGQAEGAYAFGQRLNVRGFNFGDYSTPDAATGVMGVLTSLLNRPGFTAQSLSVLGGADPRSQFGLARSEFIAQGDTDSLAGLKEEYQRTFGGILGGLKQLNADLAAATQMHGVGADYSIGSSALSGAGAGIQALQYTGGSYRQISAAQAAQGPMIQRLIVDKQRQIAAEQDPTVRAQLQADLAGLQAQQAGVGYQSRMTSYQGQSVAADTLNITAGAGLLSAMNSGTTDTGGVYAAYGQQFRAAEAALDVTRRQSLDPLDYNATDRARLAAQAAAGDVQAHIALAQGVGGFRRFFRDAGIGVFAAGRDAAAIGASLYGTPGDIYGAALGQADVTRARLGAVGTDLFRARAEDRSPQEILGLQADQKRLLAELNQEITNAGRSFYALNLSVAQASQGIAQQRASSDISYYSQGGAAADKSYAPVVSAAQATLAAAQAQFNNVKGLPANNPTRVAAAAALQSAQSGVQSAAMGYEGLGVGLATQQGLSQNSFAMQMGQLTGVNFGNGRQLLYNDMALHQQAGKDIAGHEAQELATDTTQEARDATKFRFQQQLQQNALASAQDFAQLKGNAFDNIVSSTFNAPSNFGFAASQFNARTASGNLQKYYGSLYNGDQGFGGASGRGMRDANMFLYPTLMSSATTYGNPNTMVGLLNTALAGGPGGTGAGGMVPGGGVLRAGGQTLNGTITVVVVTKDARGNTIGRGSQAATIHDLANGALTINVNPGANVSHQ